MASAYCIEPIFPRHTPFICSKGVKAGPGRSHNSFNSKYAIDLVIRNSNRAIISPVSGLVVTYNKCSRLSSKSCGHGFGNFIKILADDGKIYFFSHLQSISVRQKQRIKKGQKLGIIGHTGSASAIHLHFSVHKEWKSTGLKKHLSIPVLLSESINFDLKICTDKSCKRSKKILASNLRCSTQKITEYYIY